MVSRLIFMGTPDFAVAPLQSLVDAGYDVVAVYTREPQKSGRGMALRKSPVHELAERHNIPVETPKSFKDPSSRDVFAAYDADLAVVVAYGMILPQAILDTPKMGCWNIHASLLPRWRGAAPIHRAIMAGDSQTGISIMQMEAGLDTGPVLRVAVEPIKPEDTTASLHDRLRDCGADTLLKTLGDHEAGILRLPDMAKPQADADAVYAPKIDKAEAKLDWSRPALELVRHIHGLSPFPGAWFAYQGQRIKILSAEADMTISPSDSDGVEAGTIIDSMGRIACGAGVLKPKLLQRAGKSPLTIEEFQRGSGLNLGDLL
jgi:methionyl-tRNA formyltransferase